jgi:hypothetical protein
MTPWAIESVITHAKEMTERNGFELLPGEGGVIKIVAKKPPYGRNVTIARLNDWAAVELFFLGYEQGKLETNIVATLAKGKKKVSENTDEKPYVFP